MPLTREEKSQFIRRVLHKYFPHPAPFLHHINRFTLLVAVILSARCTDKKVNEITPLLFAKASTPEAMARLSVAEIKEIIQPCGLSPAKAKAIKETSCLLVEKFKGRVPATLEELEELPGVGHKTASVVLSQGFQKPAFPVDTHIYRLARRWGLSRHKSVKKVEEDLKKLFPEESWHDVHLQMIEAGRSFCPARGHNIEKCPICSKLAQETAPSGNKFLKKSRINRHQKKSDPSQKAK